MSRRRILLATHSQHKFGELREVLDASAPGRFELVSLSDIGVLDEAPETAETFAGNAAFKARHYARLTGLPTVADDSGLEVDALGGGPGVRTRRFAGEHATDEQNNARLLSELAGLADAKRGARYVCVLAYVDPSGVGPDGGLAVRFARGTFRGRIALAPRGTNGFGYDPIFESRSEPLVGGRTVGEWSPAEKAAVSHRAKAARGMARVLIDEGL